MIQYKQTKGKQHDNNSDCIALLNVVWTGGGGGVQTLGRPLPSIGT